MVIEPTPTLDPVDRLYEPGVAPARHELAAGAAFTALTDSAVDPALLDRFLIEFCARGVAMTRPVDDWIRQAGRACRDHGYDALGRALERHADHEAGHHELMIADTHRLVIRWNTEHPASPLDADQLLAAEPGVGVGRYVALHEDVIAGPKPWSQLAIEYEIELLSVTRGPELLGNVAAVCGADRVEALSFLTDHVALDQAHTVFNRRQINAFLTEHPEAGPDLAATGTAALNAYGAFLADCFEAAHTASTC